VNNTPKKMLRRNSSVVIFSRTAKIYVRIVRRVREIFHQPRKSSGLSKSGAVSGPYVCKRRKLAPATGQ